ncbi:NUDIX hydrolase [Streptomyces luteireticuli]|uniref:NUDIX hydrolase n=1 Tax=Streptomyces luteireticuli TaxID=173858 RepID=A0ABP3HXW8_9ACTN
MAEVNESPRAAAERELSEELGLTVRIGRLLCVDRVPSHGPWDDQLAFGFDGGVLPPEQSDALRPHDRELSSCSFFERTEALELLPPRTRRRAAHALKGLSGAVELYAEHGQERGAVP